MKSSVRWSTIKRPATRLVFATHDHVRVRRFLNALLRDPRCDTANLHAIAHVWNTFAHLSPHRLSIQPRGRGTTFPAITRYGNGQLVFTPEGITVTRLDAPGDGYSDEVGWPRQAWTDQEVEGLSAMVAQAARHWADENGPFTHNNLSLAAYRRCLGKQFVVKVPGSAGIPVTVEVDDDHLRAGSAVVRTIWHTSCLGQGHGATEHATIDQLGDLPRCQHCGGDRELVMTCTHTSPDIPHVTHRWRMSPVKQGDDWWMYHRHLYTAATGWRWNGSGCETQLALLRLVHGQQATLVVGRDRGSQDAADVVLLDQLCPQWTL